MYACMYIRMCWKTWERSVPPGSPISSAGADGAQQAQRLSALWCVCMCECVCACVYWVQPSYDFIKLPKERKCGLRSDFPFAAADLSKRTQHSCPLHYYALLHFIFKTVII